jgi:hypothetical protein
MMHRRFGILGKTPVEPRNVAGLPGSGTEGGAARADVNELFKSSRQIAEEHRKAAEAVSKTASAANTAAPALSNISPAANSAASSLNSLSAKIAGGIRRCCRQLLHRSRSPRINMAGSRSDRTSA